MTHMSRQIVIWDEKIECEKKEVVDIEFADPSAQSATQ